MHLIMEHILKYDVCMYVHLTSHNHTCFCHASMHAWVHASMYVRKCGRCTYAHVTSCSVGVWEVWCAVCKCIWKMDGIHGILSQTTCFSIQPFSSALYLLHFSLRSECVWISWREKSHSRCRVRVCCLSGVSVHWWRMCRVCGLTTLFDAESSPWVCWELLRKEGNCKRYVYT